MRAQALVSLLVISLLLIPTAVYGQSENIPNPETNGNITIQFSMYPNSYSETIFDPDASTISMSFSKQNLSQYYVINEGITKPTSSKLPTWFSINYAIQIPLIQQTPTGTSTTLIKKVSGLFQIYKVEERPQFGDRVYYADGSVSVGNATWHDTGAAFVSATNNVIHDMHIKGYE